METLIPDQILRETEEKLLLLEQKATYLEQVAAPDWASRLLIASNILMGLTIAVIIFQIAL